MFSGRFEEFKLKKITQVIDLLNKKFIALEILLLKNYLKNDLSITFITHLKLSILNILSDSIDKFNLINLDPY